VIADLEPYPAMKETGVAWIRSVPKHWKVQRLRNLAEMRVSNVDKHTKADEQSVRLCNYVDVYKNDQIRPSMPFMRATATREEVDRFRLAVGDVLITKDSETWNDIGVPALVCEAADDLISGYHLALLRPFEMRMSGAYLFRALQSTAAQYQFHVEANGVTRYGLSHAAIKSVWLPAPPLPEQVAIVRFLDHVDRRIRRFIRAKQKLIKLLEEQKQAIIHRAVTRGLDPNVRLKPSGVKLLGKVPEHWEVRKLGTLGTFHKGRGIARADITNSGVPAITYGDIYTQYAIQAKTLNKFTTAQVAARAFEIHSGDLLFAASGETVDEIGKTIVYVGTPPAYAGGDIIVLRLDQADGLYLSYVLNSKIGCGQKSAFGRGDIIVHISATKLKRIVAPLPPLDEQRRIAEFLDGAIAAISAASDSACHEINLLYEYRTRLIADVVTGKLDVREAAASLPDEQDESEPHDEPETDSDAEELSDNDTAEVAEEVEA
jgi:type I restriction enzyme S subunit